MKYPETKWFTQEELTNLVAETLAGQFELIEQMEKYDRYDAARWCAEGVLESLKVILQTKGEIE